MFTKNELEILAKLLDAASEKFSNHSCNDFKLSATVENIDLVKRVDGDDDPFVKNDNVFTTDFGLMDYFKKRCLDEAQKIS